MTEKNETKETALEVPVQKQLKKVRKIHVNAVDFEKLITLLKIITEPIDFNKKFQIIVSYDPELPTVNFDYFKSE